jgi:hypothetical protein
MSPQRKGSRRSGGWRPPRDRREIVVAVLASLTIVVVTAALVWFLRPNRDSGSGSSTETITVPTTLPAETTTAPTTVAPTSIAPTATSTP